MAQKGRYTELPNKIGLFSTSRGSFVKNDNDVVLSFPFKDAVLEAGMSKEDVGRDERFLHQELDSKDIDTLEDWIRAEWLFKAMRAQEGWHCP